MGTLESLYVIDDILFTDEVEVLVEFTHLDIGDATGNVNLAIVKEHTRVVVDARQFLLLPFAFGVSSRQQPAAGIIAIDEQVE